MFFNKTGKTVICWTRILYENGIKLLNYDLIKDIYITKNNLSVFETGCKDTIATHTIVTQVLIEVSMKLNTSYLLHHLTFKKYYLKKEKK